MATEKQHPIRNSVVATLIAGALTTLVVYLIPGGWAWVVAKGGRIIGAIATWLGSSLSVPAWLVVILSLLALATIVAVAILAYAVVRKSDDGVELFTEAEFFGIKWRWRYGQNGIYNIAAFCPECDLQVQPTDCATFSSIPRTIYRCDDGHWASEVFQCHHTEVEDRVRRKIQQELRRKSDDAKRKTA